MPLEQEAYTGAIYIPTGSWEDEKRKILAKEKDAALVKVASVYATEQDPYPSPFLNLSDMQIPRNMTEIFKWCRYYYKFDPLISGAVSNLSSFPVTEVYLEDLEQYREATEKSEPLKMYERMFFETIEIHKLLINIGIDYWLYGNCFIFGEMYDANQTGDPAYRDIQWKNIMRLDPSKMIIDVDPLTNEKTYKWDVPYKIKKIVKDKKPVDRYATIPEKIKEAVRDNKAVVLNSNNIYHFSRPGESGDGSVWGTPVVLNVLKLLMYRNILRQAQEAIAREHIVPFRIYYLNPTQAFDPMANFGNVARNFAEQLKQAARDPNYKVVSPVPVDVLNLGGQGKALMLTPEIEQIQTEILAGMGVPREFVFGGVSYSGSTISLRILENQFITYRLLLEDFMQNFIIKRLAMARGDWRSPVDDGNIITAKLSSLKMQDDVQQKQLVINLNAAGKISDDYLYNMLGIDTKKMKEQIQKEMLERVQFEAQVQQMQLQSQGQLQMMQLQQQVQLQAAQQKLYGKADIQTPEQQEVSHEKNKTKAKEEAKAEVKEKTEKKPGVKKKADEDFQFELVKQSEDMEDGSPAVAAKMHGLDITSRNIALGKLDTTTRMKVVKHLGVLDTQKAAEQTHKAALQPIPQQRPPRRQGGI